MLLVIGTYRGLTHLPTALDSIDRHLSGVTRLVFVDDSTDATAHEWMRTRGELVTVGRRGYNAAMSTVCAVAGNDPFMFFEEDFTVTVDVDLDDLAAKLTARPHLAQIALLRGPHFPIEHEHGGLLEALQARGETITDVDGILEQTATFTCNPAVWAAGIAAQGWPAGQWSEDRKRDQLLAAGYRFGFLPGIRVAHHGVRSGFDY